MQRLLILGNGRKNVFTTRLLKTLYKAEIGYFYSNDSCSLFRNIDLNPNLLIYETEKVELAYAFKPEIVIIKGEVDFLQRRKQLFPNAILLFNCASSPFVSSNASAFHDMIPVTVGNDEKSTVSVSAVNNDFITASLNRSVECIDGYMIEPREMKITGNFMSADLLPNVFACAVALLLGK